jgi:CRISPR-associated protein Csx3
MDETIKYKLREPAGEGYSLVTWVLRTGILTNDALGEAVDKSPSARPDAGLVLSGRGPTWLYLGLAHRYHYCKWVAVYDPRIGGAVVVATHDSAKRVGALVNVPKVIETEEE